MNILCKGAFTLSVKILILILGTIPNGLLNEKSAIRRFEWSWQGEGVILIFALIHSSDILSIRFKHTRILRIFGLFKKYFKILYTKANFQAFVFL
jgi:hypothetical protein